MVPSPEVVAWIVGIRRSKKLVVLCWVIRAEEVDRLLEAPAPQKYAKESEEAAEEPKS